MDMDFSLYGVCGWQHFRWALALFLALGWGAWNSVSDIWTRGRVDGRLRRYHCLLTWSSHKLLIKRNRTTLCNDNFYFTTSSPAWI